MRRIPVMLTAVFLAGCSVLGKNNVEIAPYSLIHIDKTQQIEVRHYDGMILVSTDMSATGRNGAFRKLFKYIGGDNEGNTEISMTAPVMMDTSSAKKQGTEIAMTAPVLMTQGQESAMMSFVMPKHFTLSSTPKPTDPALHIREVTDYRVAAIKFSGTLSKRNVAKQTQRLQEWIRSNGYQATSEPVEAGYHGPFTLPMFRRNEVLIELQKS